MARQCPYSETFHMLEENRENFIGKIFGQFIDTMEMRTAYSFDARHICLQDSISKPGYAAGHFWAEAEFMDRGRLFSLEFFYADGDMERGDGQIAGAGWW